MNKAGYVAKPKRCHGCRRSAVECWIMPCLVLEVALQQGADAVNRWARRAGAPFRVTPKQP